MYPFENNPKTGNSKVDLPKICKDSILEEHQLYIKLKKDLDIQVMPLS